MSVDNGQPGNKDTFNTAYVSRTTNSNTVGIVSLENEDPASGPAVDNLQGSVNLALTKSEQAVSEALAVSAIYNLLEEAVAQHDSEINDLQSILNANGPGTMFYIDENGNHNFLTAGTYGQILQLVETIGSGGPVPIPTWVDGGGGGGGSSFILESNDSTPGPNLIKTIPIDYFAFDDASQTLWGKLVVPSSHSAGNMIALENGKFFVNSTDTSKIIYMQKDVYLFRDGGQAPTSLANALASSLNNEDGVFTTVPGTANYQTKMKLFLTDNGGLINGQAVNANDLIIVAIKPNFGETDSYVGQINLINGTFIPNFTAEW